MPESTAVDDDVMTKLQWRHLREPLLMTTVLVSCHGSSGMKGTFDYSDLNSVEDQSVWKPKCCEKTSRVDIVPIEESICPSASARDMHPWDPRSRD